MKKQDPDNKRALRWAAQKQGLPTSFDRPERTKRNTERRIAKAELQRKALELRKAGANFPQIGEQLGISQSHAWKCVDQALKDIPREAAKDVQQLELQRLDALLLGVWAKAKAGDPQAVDRALRVMERRAHLLGLDAPKKTSAEIESTITVTEGAHEALLARISGITDAVAAREGNSEPH